jgi:hypothetical protein
MDDTYDDGLVHNHNWAAEPPTRAGGIKLHGEAMAAAMSAHPEDVEPFDDGLVHGHDWARS